MRVDALDEPDTGTNDCIVPDDGAPAEDGSVGIEDNPVFNRRVTFLIADQVSIVVGWKAECTESNALVDFYILADIARLANHDARAVVDEEVVTDRCARVNVDAGAAVS